MTAETHPALPTLPTPGASWILELSSEQVKNPGWLGFGCSLEVLAVVLGGTVEHFQKALEVVSVSLALSVVLY